MTTFAELPYVEAELNYLGPMTARPRYYAYEMGPETRSNLTPEPHRVRIHSMRPIQSELDLDRQGFELVEQKSAVRDFWNDDEVREVYYPEAERFIAAATGAGRVFIFDHVQRRRVPGTADRAPGGPRQPATRVHVDHTARSGPQRVRDLMGDEAEELLKGRVQVINMWRPIQGPLRDAPLALCDSRTVDPQDLVPSDLVYRERVGETYSVKFNPAHRWYYAPEMRTDEALLLKIADTRTDVAARFMPHTSFTDPTTPPDAFPRESIELRSLVFHAA
jgi:hypothetical protein